MLKIKKILLGIVFALFPLLIVAQVPQLQAPWSFGFEESDSAMMKYWKINLGGDTTNCKERWVVSSYLRSQGNYSLMISNDGYTPEFGTIPNACYAYFDFTLPAGQYVLSFDWRCQGSDANAYLCAGVGIAQQMPDLQSNYITPFLNNSVIQFAGENKMLNNMSKWKNASIDVSSNGTRIYRLYFAWSNSNRDSLPNRIAASVDNIQITTRNCPRPQSVSAEVVGDSVVVSWKGTTEQYCLEYRKYGRSKWFVQTGIYGDSFVIEGLDEGAYDFRVRGVCNDVDTSAYTYLNTFGIYYPERHCINYINLYDDQHVLATYGSYKDPYLNVGIVDTSLAGVDSKFWRHTVNWDPFEYDPRTGNQLKIVPEDEVASIRLGNWNLGSEGESLSFFYTVDAENAAILLLKYAVVLEDPNHGQADQPRFTLEILDQYGQLIDPTCGAADFYADSHRQGWNIYGGVTWKDWTVVGLNLADYDGETLTVRLTTRDCNWGGHYGYAYFTVGCVNAKIHNTSCGDDSQMSIEAPSGFRYQWYDKYDQEVPESLLENNGRILNIPPTDTTTYRCHLTYLEETSCGFDLYSSNLPRFPIASFDWEYVPSGCRNKVKFSNKSHIMTMFNNVVEYHHDQPCDEYDWDFGNGMQASDRNPVVTFPNKGGRFAVTLNASIADGQCVDDTVIYIDIPAIGDTILHLDTTICQGNYVTLGPKFCGLDSTYDYTWQTASGCDSTIYLSVHLNPVTNEYAGDTIVCAEEPLIIDGQRYKQFPESGMFYRFYTNQYGCDSTLWMNVTVRDSIKPEIIVEDLGGSATGKITLGGTGYDYYTLNGVENATLTGLKSGIYTFEFFNDIGCSVEEMRVLGFDSLRITTAETLALCGDSTIAYMPFVVEGTPVSSYVQFHYKMWFDNKAVAAGFPGDTIFADMPYGTDVFAVNIPAGIRPGFYTVNIIGDNELSGDVALSFTIRVDFSANVIFQRWNDVLSLCNADVLGDSVQSFQWLKNGEEIAGATKSYYYAEGGLDLTSTYSVRMVMSDGSLMYTCEFTPIDNPADIQLYPTVVASGGAVQVRVPETAQLECFNMQGVAVSSQTLEQGTNTWQAPATTGVYVVKIKTTNDLRTFIVTVLN